MTLEMKGIYKSFGANDVLRDVSFTSIMRIRARSYWTASALRFKRRRIP